NLRQPDAADQLALRIPDRDAAIADRAPGIARAPEIAVDIGAHAVRPALHAVDHEIAEQLLVRQLVVGADIEHMHVALAAGAGIARPFAGAHHIELLEVGREADAVGIRHLLLGDDEIDPPARIDTIAVGRKLAPRGPDA